MYDPYDYDPDLGAVLKPQRERAEHVSYKPMTRTTEIGLLEALYNIILTLCCIAIEMVLIWAVFNVPGDIIFIPVAGLFPFLYLKLLKL